MNQSLISYVQSSTLAVIFQAQCMIYVICKTSNLEITSIPVTFLFLNSAKCKQQGWKNERDLYLPFHVPKITNGLSQDKCPHHTYYSTSHWNVGSILLVSATNAQISVELLCTPQVTSFLYL